MNDKYDDILQYEEDFHSEDKKLFRKEKKRAIEHDRSKYKKTDQDQLKKKAFTAPQTGPLGRVLAIYPEGIEVEYEGNLYRCGLKGSLKKEKSRSKNLVAVGDFVRLQIRDHKEGLITSIEPRFSILSRADNLHRRKEQLIAVNVNQVIITASIYLPTFKPFLIDRYIIAARKGNMDPVIVINKIDLLDKESETYELLLECQAVYEKLSIPLIMVSASTGEGVGALKNILKNKSSVFSGQSGVGKSSLINSITDAGLKTGRVVGKTMKGAHTTTSTQLLRLEGGGFCVDTPGIKSFGIWDISEAEAQQYFSEIAEVARCCKFPDCSHQTEEDCAVKQAVESDEISAMRFASYTTLIETLKEEHRLR